MTQKSRVLAMLERGPTTTAEFLNAYIPRFSARIEELRRDGYVIERTRSHASSYVYKLAGVPSRQSSGAVPRPNVAHPSPAAGEAPRQTLFPVEHTPLGIYESEAAA